MKTTQLIKKSMLLWTMALLLSMFSLNQATAQTANYDPSGTWLYEVEMPDTKLTGELTITKTKEGYEVVIKSNVYGTLELEDITFEKMILKGSSDVEGGAVGFEWKFEGDQLKGTVDTEEGVLSMTAKKKKK